MQIFGNLGLIETEVLDHESQCRINVIIHDIVYSEKYIIENIIKIWIGRMLGLLHLMRSTTGAHGDMKKVT